MHYNRTVQLVALVLAAAGFLGAGALITPINRVRQELRLEVGSVPGESMPPEVALLTAALGSFRGLAVDVLWYRANELKEAGKYYEANTLSQWITTLQPKFPQVWAFHAWNMAYNISVATHTPEERWDWVNKGIRLLRERGIPTNPQAVRLYRELSWIFFHKVGQFSDDMHWYYKRELAYEMQEFLGDLDRGGSTDEVVNRFRNIADAPDTIEELVKTNPGVKKVIDRIRELGYEPNEAFLRSIGRFFMVYGSLDAQILGDRYLSVSGLGIDMNLVQGLLRHEDLVKNLPPVLAFLRKKVLKDRYNMKAGEMLALMEDFGPIDWRHPSAHGAYWARLGSKLADELTGDGDKQRDGIPIVADNTEVDLVNTFRQNIHSLQDLTRYGKVVFDPVTRRIQLMPDPRFIPAYEKNLEMAQKAYKELFGKESDSYESGHENFLLMAIQYSFLYGDRNQAQAYYDKIRRLYGDRPHNKFTRRYEAPLEDLVLSQLTEDITMMHQAMQFIDAMVNRSIEEGLVTGRPEVFARYIRLGQRVHERFQRDKAVNPTATQDRMRLPPWKEVFFNAYTAAMKDDRRDPLSRARIWANTPVMIQREVYDSLLPIIKPQFEAVDLDVTRAFREPPDMEGWRSANSQTEGGAPKAAPAPPPSVERK